MSIYHKTKNENDEDESHTCELKSMPNWGYSYALALYKLSFMVSTDEEAEELTVKATEALTLAIHNHPFVPRLILEKNKVNITGRSFQTDWPSVLNELDTREVGCTGYLSRDYQVAKHKIVSIFIERSHKLWCGDDVVKWLFDRCAEVVSSEEKDNSQVPVNVPIALLRYSKYDPIDFQDSFPNIPAANALDPRFVDLAMHVRPNARRLLRMPNQRGGGVADEFNLEGERAMQQIRTLLGTGRDGMEVIDPDLPIAEIFWRSMMPWARVDGVPPGAPP